MGYDRKKDWRCKARRYLAAAFGGKCTICGYDKTISALDYHHVDPSQKDKILSVAMRNGYAWHKIAEEARKCTIVCCRCHREIHAGVTKLPKHYARFNEEYVDVIKLKQREFDSCPVCGAEKLKKQKFCSLECSNRTQRRFEISKEDLERLVAEQPYEKIGEMFQVSGKAIKKRCDRLGVSVGPRRGYWAKKNAAIV